MTPPMTTDQAVHQNKSSKDLKCPFCPKKFKAAPGTNGSINRHIETMSHKPDSLRGAHPRYGTPAYKVTRIERGYRKRAKNEEERQSNERQRKKNWKEREKNLKKARKLQPDQPPSHVLVRKKVMTALDRFRLDPTALGLLRFYKIH